MKKIVMFLVFAALVFAPHAFAEEGMHAGHTHAGEQSNMMKVYQCSMDKYTAEKPGECPLCGMTLEKKEMPADEAKKALEESKSKE